MPIEIHTPKSKKKSDDSGEYWQGFRRKVFKLVKMGYDRLDSKKYRDWEEPDITGKLKEEIEAVIDDPLSPRWISRFVVQDESPINATGRLGKHRKIIDILIQRTRRGPNPRYYFEAKRLSGNNFTAIKYLGQTGLGEFISGNYAFNESEAGMLGYVQSGNPAEWASKILFEFKKNKASIQVCSGGEWTYVQIISELNCYCSKHKRPSIGRPITIYHSLLNFC